MVTTTHSKVIFSKKAPEVPQITGNLLIEKLLKAFSILDIEAISELIPEDSTFEGYSNKYGFLVEYKEIFEEIKDGLPFTGTPLLIVPGKCFHCLLKYPSENQRLVFCLIENEKKDVELLSIVFEIDKNDILADMYQCYMGLSCSTAAKNDL
jgi:hypothetical protein